MLFFKTPRQNPTVSSLFLLRNFSRLYQEYNFISPSSFRPQTPAENPSKQKRKKPPYRPPSSLDRSNHELTPSDLPFDFRFSYTESNQNVRPIGLREPKYSPFGPGRVDRIWTGVCAPAVEPVLKSVDGGMKGGEEEELERKRKVAREKVIGEPLSQEERSCLIEACQKNRSKRQVNLGRDGLTHNMLNDIHNNWKNAEAVRIKCLGVPTVDMKNICAQLEDKTGGVIIHRHGGQIMLYRGRYYNPKRRPNIPLMLWKPHEPIYPTWIKTTIEGLTIEESKAMRKKGLEVPALTRLAKNGYYAFLVPMVRDAFLAVELVRIDCKGLPRTDYKKIGVKLRDLVPCIPVTFEKEQIVLWRGENYSCGTNHNREKNLFLSDLEFSSNNSEENYDEFIEKKFTSSPVDQRSEISDEDSSDATY